MKFIFPILLIVLSAVATQAYSQTDSPIGKWILTEHVVARDFDSTSSIWQGDKNVYHKDFKAVMLFEKGGRFEHHIGDNIRLGEWELTNKGRKLTIQAGSQKFKAKWDESKDFEAPFYYSEQFNQLYENADDSLFGGTSTYIRVSGQKPDLDTALLIGKWRVTHIQIGNKKTEYSSNRTMVLNVNGTLYDDKASGKWKVNGSKLTVNLDDYGNVIHVPSTYKIDKLSETELVYSGMEGKKRAVIYWHKTP